MSTSDLTESIIGALIESSWGDETKTPVESLERKRAAIRGVVEPVIADLERRLEMVRETIRGAKQSHLQVEDCWYSCPKSGECCNEGEGTECNCGADAHNAALDTALAQLSAPLGPVEGTWSWALGQMKAGRRMKRPRWIQTGYVAIDRDGRFYYESQTRDRHDWQIYLDDIEAVDWRIADEPIRIADVEETEGEG